jgi:hypothetical protein
VRHIFSTQFSIQFCVFSVLQFCDLDFTCVGSLVILYVQFGKCDILFEFLLKFIFSNPKLIAGGLFGVKAERSAFNLCSIMH